MNFTNLLTSNAMEFTFLGIPVRTTMLLSIIIILIITACWIWNKVRSRSFEEAKLNQNNPLYCQIHRKHMIFMDHPNPHVKALKCPIKSCTFAAIKDDTPKPPLRIVGKFNINQD